MPLPPGIEVGTVVGPILGTDGDPASGIAKFRPTPRVVLDETNAVVLTQQWQTVTLDADGDFSIDLVGTDNTELNPIDWTWEFLVEIDDGYNLSGALYVPSGVTTPLAMVMDVNSSEGRIVGGRVPPGGTAGQVLTKVSGVDYDDEWADSTGGGGGGGGATNLNGLTDVTITGGATGHVLRRDGAGQYVNVLGTTYFDVAGAAATAQSAAEATAAAALNAHLADTVDAHDASAVSVVPFSTIAATTVQAALEEIVAETGAATQIVHYSTVGTARPGATYVIWVPTVPTLAAPTNATGSDLVIYPTVEWFEFALSDETTVLQTVGTGKKIGGRWPFAGTLVGVVISVETVASSGVVTVDVNKNLTTQLSTKATIEVGEFSSLDAAAQPVISVPSFAINDRRSIDIDVTATGATGLKCQLGIVRT